MKLTRLCSHAPVAALLPARVGQVYMSAALDSIFIERNSTKAVDVADILVAAPQFNSKANCREPFTPSGNPRCSNGTLRWRLGSSSVDGEKDVSKAISSYAVLDEFLAFINKCVAPERIALFGFSAGAQMLQRYSLVSKAMPDNAEVFLGAGMGWAYIDERRPVMTEENWCWPDEPVEEANSKTMGDPDCRHRPDQAKCNLDDWAECTINYKYEFEPYEGKNCSQFKVSAGFELFCDTIPRPMYLQF